MGFEMSFLMILNPRIFERIPGSIPSAMPAVLSGRWRESCGRIPEGSWRNPGKNLSRPSKRNSSIPNR